jgi:hypothetical protein
LAGAYSYNQNIGFTGTNFAAGLVTGGALNSTNSFALSGYWQPSQSGWIPSISAGWGVGTTQQLTRTGGYTGVGGTLNSWTIGLQWSDAFVKGNALGMGFGQNTMVSQRMNAAVTPGAPADGNWAWEWWYKFQATDNISITPGIFYLSRPLGGNTALNVANNNSYFSSFGYLIKTTFKF